MLELNKEKNNKLFKFIIIYMIIMAIITGTLIVLYYKYNIDIDLSKLLKNSNKVNSENENKHIENSDRDNNNQEIIFNHNHDNNGTDEKDNLDSENIKRTSLTDKYYFNNIELEKKEEKYGNIIKNSDDGPIYKAEISYLEINGLKSKDIQNKINNEIKEKVKSLVSDEEIKDKNIYRIYIVVDESNLSTADLLSFPVTKYIKYNKIDEEVSESHAINYRLDTGEEIKLKDIFTKDASIKNILSQSLYNYYAFEYGFDSESLDGDFDTVDYGKIENDVFNVINKFNKQEETEFWFDQEYINIIVDNQSYSIATQEFSEYININNIVNLSETIYENGNNPKVNYVYAKPFASSFEYFDKVSEDSYLSIFNYYITPYMTKEYEENKSKSEIERETKYKNNLKNNISNIVNAIKKDTKKDKGKGYAYNITSYQEAYTDYNGQIVPAKFMGEKVEVDLKNFKQNIENVYALNSRQPTGGDYMFSFYNLIYYQNNKYKVYDIVFEENNNELKLGQRLYNTDWTIEESEYEF